MSVHRIHLRGPWSARWLTADAPHSVPGAAHESRAESSTDERPPEPADSRSQPPLETQRVKIPGDWIAMFGSRSGRVRFTRRFQCPTNLDPKERVYVTLDGVTDQGTITVNGTSMGTFGNVRAATRFDITELLRPSNELQLDVQCTPQPGRPNGIFRHVALEIASEDLAPE